VETLQTIEVTYPYGQPITIHFSDVFYFTASNLVTFTPSLPTGSFAANTSIGPYYAVSADGFVLLLATDTVTGQTYAYEITITAPIEPPNGEDGSAT